MSENSNPIKIKTSEPIDNIENIAIEEVQAIEEAVTLAEEAVASVGKEKEPVEVVAETLLEEGLEVNSEGSEGSEGSEEDLEDNLDDDSDLFVTDDDTFDITVRYYIKDNKKHEFIIEGESEEFKDGDHVKSFNITFSYPCLEDLKSIADTSQSLAEVSFMNKVIGQEYNHLLILVKSWTLPRDTAWFAKLDANLINSIVAKVREKIGLSGIL